MPYAVLALLILFPAALNAQAVRGYGSDSLILQEIADSLHVRIGANTAWVEGGRVTRLSIYYQGQSGALPAAVGRLDSLHYLYMGITGVTSLPPEIGLLKRMDTIDIGSSRIGPTLPEEIGDLSNLRFLRVSGCGPLKTLPTSLMRLKKATLMDFSHNSICDLDDSLRNWILAISPNALNYESGCEATGIREAQTNRGRAPLFKLVAPGQRIYPAQASNREGKILYYSPLGRRLESHKARSPISSDADAP